MQVTTGLYQASKLTNEAVKQVGVPNIIIISLHVVIRWI